MYESTPKKAVHTRPPTLHVVSDLTKQADKLVKDWAAQFRTSHVRTVEAIVERGALFNKGKRALGYGNWTKALAEAGISERTAEYFMLIVDEKSVTSNPKFFRFFPATVSSLNYLATRPRELVEDQLNEGRINPNMTKDQLVELFEPTTAEPAAKPPLKKGKKSKDHLTWPTSVDASIKSFFAGAFHCDTQFPGEVVWTHDEIDRLHGRTRHGLRRIPRSSARGGRWHFLPSGSASSSLRGRTTRSVRRGFRLPRHPRCGVGDGGTDVNPKASAHRAHPARPSRRTRT